MRIPSELYRPSLALLTDLYELTMAYAYWKSGLAEREAVFHVFFRENPFHSGYSVAAGLPLVLDFLETFHFEPEDLEYLASLEGADGKPLFPAPFLEHLRGLRLRIDVDAIPEGSVVFAPEPLMRVRGPILEAQIVETALLTLLNFQTLIATKASRVKQAAHGKPVLEFGLRRAQGIDGGLAASRAAFVGGCDATSNTMAGRLYGIPVRGTHAHSWVMAFDDEQTSFQTYAEAMPNNALLLVDTYDSLEGTRRAAKTGHWLHENGHPLQGIRLDSGDLAYLSNEARKILDAEGFPEARIVGSGDLDEQIMESLQEQGNAIDTFGVGTKLATAFDQPALGGVYKLAAVRGPDGEWKHRIKVSEQMVKTTTPGILQVRRFEGQDVSIADMIWDELSGCEGQTIVDPVDPTRRKQIPEGTPCRDLLEPALRGGKRVAEPQPIHEARARAQRELARLHPGIKRLLNPHVYPVGLERRLHALKTDAIMRARGAAQAEREEVP